MINPKIDLERFDRVLSKITAGELKQRNQEAMDTTDQEYASFQVGYASDICYLCRKPFKTISAGNPCLHWLLRRCSFKKKDFHLVYTKYEYHQISSYLRWVANQERFQSNINDLDSEKDGKLIQTTIKWKNVEWTFSCTMNDYNGHENAFSCFPHYHFQMRIDKNPFIRFNEYHLPFSKHDIFLLDLSLFRPDKVFENSGPGGSGMQDAMSITPEQIIETSRRTENPENATYQVQTIAMAKEGHLLGARLADMMKEHRETGKTLASLASTYLGAEAENISTKVSPSDTIPVIAARTTHMRGKK